MKLEGDSLTFCKFWFRSFLMMNTGKKICKTLIKQNVYILELQSELNS